MHHYPLDIQLVEGARQHPVRSHVQHVEARRQGEAAAEDTLRVEGLPARSLDPWGQVLANPEAPT